MLPMLERAVVQQIVQGHACPPGVGPAWREACAAGMDMSLVELNLAKSPWQRMCDHDGALELAMMLREAVSKNYAPTEGAGRALESRRS